MGPPADLPDLRPRRLLRQLTQPPRHRPPPHQRPPDHPAVRAGRELVVVLRGPARLRGRGGRAGALAPLSREEPVSATDHLVANNGAYAARFTKGRLSGRPATGVAVLACM